MSTNIQPLPQANTINAALQNVLEQSYALYQATHYYHWNVEGPRFVALHTLFEEHYTELFAALDEIAERIRAIGSYVEPLQVDAGLQAIQADNAADARASQMIEHLISLHEAVIKAASKAKELADDADDDASEDLMIGRITIHQKTLWMLKSLNK